MITDRHATATSFRSILFVQDAVGTEAVNEPGCFGDLHLDQIVTSVTAGREEYELAPFFYRPLHDVEAVHYRHHVLRDLERVPVLEAVREFADEMREMRKHLALEAKLHHVLQKQRWFVEALVTYCRAVADFAEKLVNVDVRSRGFVGLREYLTGYVASEVFTSLVAETQSVVDELASVSYSLQIKGNRVRVDRYDGEPDMSEQVDRIFAKFKQAPLRDYRVKIPDWAVMNHVEGRILDLVRSCSGHLRTARTVLRKESWVSQRYGRQVRPRGAVLPRLPRAHCPVQGKRACILDSPGIGGGPRMSGAPKRSISRWPQNSLRTAARSQANPGPTLMMRGANLGSKWPNNGGKTTFARTFGQLHYLAGLGLPVAGEEVRLFLADRIFTHFEREEDIETLRGKFEDELFRIHEILAHATGDSVLIMNESFGSTTLRDALTVGTEVMRRSSTSMRCACS